MKTTINLEGKKNTRKEVKVLDGAESPKRLLNEAKETCQDEPKVQNDFFIGSGMLTIEFA